MANLFAHFDIVLYVCGALTFSMVAGIFQPDRITQSLLGISPDNDAMRLLVRHWSFMVATSGLFLIWAGADESVRTPILLYALLGKAAVIIALIKGHHHMGDKANPLPVIIADGIMVILFALYLIAA